MADREKPPREITTANRRRLKRPEPPIETRFKPGQSGNPERMWRKGQASPNPGGRPRTARISEAYRVGLQEPQPGDPRRRSRAEVIAERVLDAASEGDLGAVREIADRVEGRAQQSLSVTTGPYAQAEADFRALPAEERDKQLSEGLVRLLSSIPDHTLGRLIEAARKHRADGTQAGLPPKKEDES